MKRRLLIAAAFLAGLAILAIVGIDDPQQEQQTYCQNVRDGVWPDFHHTFKDECGGKDPPQFHEDLAK